MITERRALIDTLTTNATGPEILVTRFEIGCCCFYKCHPRYSKYFINRGNEALEQVVSKGKGFLRPQMCVSLRKVMRTS